MQLIDKEIREEYNNLRLLILCHDLPDASYDFNIKQIQPASIDLRLGPKISRFKNTCQVIDTRDLTFSKANNNYTERVYKVDEPIVLEPHEIVFGSIYEWIGIPDTLSARVRGRNKISRLGISVHCTGDYINPGFAGEMPLQIVNHNVFPVILYPYMDICQMVLYRLKSEPEFLYSVRKQAASDLYLEKSTLFPNRGDRNPDRIMIQKKLEQQMQALKESTPNVDNKQLTDKKRTFDNNGVAYVNGPKQDVNFNVYLKGVENDMSTTYKANQVGIQGTNAGKQAKVYMNQNNGGDFSNEFLIQIKEAIAAIDSSNELLDESKVQLKEIMENARIAEVEKSEEKKSDAKKAFGYVKSFLKQSAPVLISTLANLTKIATFFGLTI